MSYRCASVLIWLDTAHQPHPLVFPVKVPVFIWGEEGWSSQEPCAGCLKKQKPLILQSPEIPSSIVTQQTNPTTLFFIVNIFFSRLLSSLWSGTTYKALGWRALDLESDKLFCFFALPWTNALTSLRLLPHWQDEDNSYFVACKVMGTADSQEYWLRG